MSNKMLEVKDLRTSFFTHLGEVKAIRGLSFHLSEGESVGIVGESGSGKSVTALSIMQLLVHPGKVVGGEVIFRGKDLLKNNKNQMQEIRGNDIAMIFQDPMTSLNPLLTVGNQISEAIVNHQNVSKSEAKQRAIKMLEMVGIPSPEARFKMYPFEFSGGMRQRAMIAMSLSCQPDVLIADEPTTALDVTIQAQVLDLIKDLREKNGTSVMLITHDLGVVADVCSRVIVMYGGLMMEEGTAEDIFYRPMHPYTIGLLKSVPRLDVDSKQNLVPIKGTPPDLLKPPLGCPFAARCEHAMNICLTEQPPFVTNGETQKAACWLHTEDCPEEMRGVLNE